ncbi:hypothetical protein [Holdemanella biformis]|uniref:hypothetical protein n=1 Tax=Holdemanella biformis TaxID=1735 RepID=UPI0026602AE3|nr:hypothetical protein [Holdemanella biformis]
MATQYDDFAHSTDGAIMEALGDEILENMYDDELLQLWFEFRSERYNEYYYELDNDNLDSCLSSYEPNEIVRMTLAGDFHYCDDYFIINDYENLESFSDYRLLEEARKDDEFKTWLTDEKSDWDMDWLEETRKQYLAYLKEGY